jgi:predicted enzyme related to lactoylglutathione lyase
MITALHSLIYADDADAARAFFRDVLRFPAVDTGGGWLIFKTGPSELGVHPNAWEYGDAKGGTDQHFELSFCCDDLPATIADMVSRGAELEGEMADQPWGITQGVRVPGAPSIMLYQPKYDPPALLPD